MGNKRKPIGCLVNIVVGIVVLFYIAHLWSEVDKAEKQVKETEKKMVEVASITRSDVEQVNMGFLEKFFTYNSTKERYEGIKPLMTEEGYRSTFPSGSEVPETDQSVKSTLSELRQYLLQTSKTEAVFLNEFNVTTQFNGVENLQTIIVRTILSWNDGSWLITEVEFIGQLTSQGEQK